LLDGIVVLDVPMAYWTLCPVAPALVTAFTVMLLMAVDCTVGAPLTAAPSPLSISLAVMVPVGVIAAVAPITFTAGMLDARVRVLTFALYVVGVPEIGMVTVVLFVLNAVPAVSPGGRLPTVKLEVSIDELYVPLVKVYTTLALLASACPTFRLVRPIAVTAMEGGGDMAIAALTRTAPAL